MNALLFALLVFLPCSYVAVYFERQEEGVPRQLRWFR